MGFQNINLSELKSHESATIVKISDACDITYKNRLLDLGFITGASVSVYTVAPMGNTKAYLIQNSCIALRDEQAKWITIKKEEK